MDRRVLKVLSLPRTIDGMERLQHRSGLVVSVLQRLVGTGTIRDIAVFVHFLEELADTIAPRVRSVRDQLAHARFYLVTTPVPAAQLEALAFLQELQARDLPFHGYLVNRCAPCPKHGEPPPLPSSFVPPAALEQRDWNDILRGVRRAHPRFERLAQADRDALDRLRQAVGPGARLWRVPTLPEEAGDLRALTRLGHFLPGLNESDE